MRYFSVAYQPLQWPLPDFMEVIATDPVGDGVVDLGEHYPRLARRGATLSEYATLFALRRRLQDEWGGDTPPPGQEMVGISHYRRFAVTRPVPGGTPSFVYDLVAPQRFADLPRDLFVPPHATLVLPAPVTFAYPVLTQYGLAHPVEDLLRFMAIAIDLGVVDDETVWRFLGGDTMLVAPSVGVYPAEWLVTVLELMEAVVDEFEARFPTSREGYQSRAVGFCLERLHSLMTLTLATAWPAERLTANRALVVSPDGLYRDGAGRLPS